MCQKGVFDWLKITFIKQCEEEKGEETEAIFRNTSCKLLSRFLSNLICRVTYMEGIKYVNLIEIGLVVIEIQRVKNSVLVV